MNQKAPKLVTITILSTITIIFWVFFSLYQILTNKADTQVPETLLEEINPVLDTTTLNLIQNRLFFEEGQVEALPEAEVNNINVTPAPTAPPELSPSESPTTTGTPIPTP
jgi:hypothetical protein